MGLHTAGRPAETVAAAGPATIRDVEGRRLVAECLAGDAGARERFQERFASLIYRFPECTGGRAQVEPGDFYLYLFDGDRIFRRLRSYEGRASLGPFLRGFVLPDLFKQFQLMTKKHTLETVSLDTDCPREPASASASAGDSAADKAEGRAAAPRCEGLFEQLSPEKWLLVKLLYIEDFTLEPEDVQLLAQRSGRPIHEVVELVGRARESVRTREAARREKQEEAESAAHWMLQYERRLAHMADDLANLPPQAARAERLREQRAELERKREWRRQQRQRAITDSQRTTVTLRYREVAEILNEPVGTVSAQITRLRQELLELAAQRASRRLSPRPPGEGQGEG